ncbi:hypothetical protein BDN72DRAFT_779441, partial [Pluteus cervinus]
MEPASIPNLSLARFGPRHSIRVFFPGLYNKNRQSVHLTVDERRIFFDRILLKAVQRAIPNLVHHWPSTFDAELFRAKNRVHGFQNGTIPISADDIDELSKWIVHYADKCAWGKKLVFGTQIRGVKDLHYHDSDDTVEAFLQLDSLFDKINRDVGLWWVDVGLEVFTPERALLWRTDAHSLLAAEVLGVDQERVQGLINNNRLYRRDLSSHLTSVSGYRLFTSREPGEHEAVFLQAYTTDKAATYHRDQHGCAKALTIKEAMEAQTDNKVPKFITGLLDLYKDCSRQRATVAARIEVRVPLRCAEKVLCKFNVQVITNCLLNMESNRWW